MSFSLKSKEFETAISKIRSIASTNMDSSDLDLKSWAQNIMRVNFVFNPESIDQFEQNLIETRKWPLFSLVDTVSVHKDNELELLKITSIVILIYLQEAYFNPNPA